MFSILNDQNGEFYAQIQNTNIDICFSKSVDWGVGFADIFIKKEDIRYSFDSFVLCSEGQIEDIVIVVDLTDDFKNIFVRYFLDDKVLVSATVSYDSMSEQIECTVADQDKDTEVLHIQTKNPPLLSHTSPF